MMKLDRNTLLLLAAGVLVWWFSGSPAPQPQPFAPPQDRPVLRWIARAAKTALWVMIFAEGPPAQDRPLVHAHGDVGEDGYATIQHGRGW
jgi:hypothetical protein